MLGRLAPATARMYLSSARSFLAWLENETGVPSPAARVGIGTASRERERKPALSPSEAAIVITRLEERSGTLSGLRDLALVRCVMLCCVRIKEAVAANVADFVEDPVFKAVMASGIPVMLDAKSASCLEAYLSMRDVSACDPLFASAAPRNYGGRLTARSVSRILANALEPVGKKPGDVNFARTAIEAALAGEAPEEDVREFARLRGYDLVFQGEKALVRRSTSVVDAIAKCMGKVGLARTTAGELRGMLQGLDDDEPLSAAVESDGSFIVSLYVAQ